MNLMLFVLLAVADLPPEDLTQLNTASDGTALLDEAAWYPLLRRAAGTEPEPRPGALIPDYGAIAASPQQHRGQRWPPAPMG